MHLRGRLEIAFAVGKEFVARFVNRAAVADTDENVLQRTAAGIVIVHVIRREEGDVEMFRKIEQIADVRFVVDAVEAGYGERETVAKCVAQDLDGLEIRRDGETKR